MMCGCRFVVVVCVLGDGGMRDDDGGGGAARCYVLWTRRLREGGV